MIGGYGQEQTQTPNQNNANRRQAPARKECLIPVTCKILRGTEKLNEEQGTVGGDGKMRIYGEDECQVMLVGLIEEQPLVESFRIVFQLTDTTDRIQVQHYFTEDDPDAEFLKNLKKNSYVRIVGKARGVKEPLMVAAQITKPIEHADEISYHLIESAHVALKQKQSGLLGGLKAGAGIGMVPTAGKAVAAETVTLTPTKSPPPAPTFAAPVGQVMPVPEKTNTLEDVLKTFLKIKGEAGCTVTDLKTHCAGKFEEASVQKWIDIALEDGTLFNTVDEVTVALTEE